MRITYIYTILSLFLLSQKTLAQQVFADSAKKQSIETSINNGFDTTFNLFPFKSTCKQIRQNPWYFGLSDTITNNKYVRKPIAPNTEALDVVKSSKLITVHGSVYYEYFFRSKTDTPFAQSNLQQHTERISLQVAIRNQYPFQITFNSRQSNSPYYRNFIDPTLKFDIRKYQLEVKNQIKEKIKTQLPGYEELKLKELALNEEIKRLDALESWQKNTGYLQKIIEEKETNHFQKWRISERIRKDSLERIWRNEDASSNPQVDSILALKGNIDSLSSITKILSDVNQRSLDLKSNIDVKIDSIGTYAANYKAKIDSQRVKVKSMQLQVDSLSKKYLQTANALKDQFSGTVNRAQLKKFKEKYGITYDSLSKLQTALASIEKLEIGRTVVSYTDLTISNLVVTGVNVVYNPGLYFAFTAGKIDYRFRDFFNRSIGKNNQYVVMGRMGLGNPQAKAIIFSVFKGRKNQSEFNIPDSVSNSINVIGYSVEAILRKNAYTTISAEFAKSTKPFLGSIANEKLLDPLLRMRDQSNTGLSLKAQTRIAATDTRLSGFYRSTGEHFNCFSLFNYQTAQTAWQVRADQSFWKKRVSLIGMIRRNDFVNPFLTEAYQSTTIFGSATATIRAPKWPILSVGYYPGTQLYFVNRETLRENVYYVLNSSIIYSYWVKNIGMNTTIIYNCFTNQATDSGFIASKGKNYYLSQSLFLPKLQLQGGYNYNLQEDFLINTWEAMADFSPSNWFKIGWGGKYNKVTGGNSYLGQRAQLSIDVKKIGSIQFQYEKSYLPSTGKELYPIESGRIIYYKQF